MIAFDIQHTSSGNKPNIMRSDESVVELVDERWVTINQRMVPCLVKYAKYCIDSGGSFFFTTTTQPEATLLTMALSEINIQYIVINNATGSLSATDRYTMDVDGILAEADQFLILPKL